MTPDTPERRLAAILSADVVGYSRLMAEDEAETVRTLSDYREEVGMLVRQHRGRLVDFTGDNFLAAFPTATDAVSCAVEIQGILRVRNESLPEERRMHFRIGIHSGEVRDEAGRLYGDGVNIAARLEGLAEAGGICVSGTVHEQVLHKLQLVYEDLGEQRVKNVPEPIHAYRIGKRHEAPPLALKAAPAPKFALAILFVLLVAALGAVLWRNPPQWEGNRAVPAGDPLPTAIAVLPFADMSPGRDQEYFADGVSEELINALSKVPGLRIAARTSAFAFKGKNEDVRTIGEQLNVGAVVEGSVRKAGDRVRITAQLVRVSDGFHIWSETYDRELDDVFAIQDDIARATVNALKVRLAGSAPLVPRQTGNLRAYELYLTGRHFWNQRTEEGFRKATGYFEQALELEPDYVLAYVGLADSYLLSWNYRYDGFERALELAEAAATRALAIDDNSGEAHASLGMIRNFQWRWDEAEREFTRALELNPGYATAHHWFSWYLVGVGRSREAMVEMKRALELDPLSPTINRDAGWHHLFAGDYAAASERAKRAVELNPNDPHGWTLLTHSFLAQGRQPQTFEFFPGQRSRPDVQRELQAVYRMSGHHALLRKSLELRIAETGKHCTDMPYFAARDFAVIGEVDRMFECLRDAVDQGQVLYPQAEPAFRRYQSDPRFVALIERMGLQKYAHGEGE